jgi:glycosyltransferase involved in cell wall biosynthesis
MLQALKHDYALTVLTWEAVDLAGTNRFYGTSLEEGDFEVRRPAWGVRAVLGLDPDPASVQPMAWLMRLTRRMRQRFDVVLTAATEELDLGSPAIQYLHFPHLNRFWPRYQPPAGLSVAQRLRAMWKGRLRPWMWLADYSVERFRRNVLLANSDWTAALVDELYGVRPRTIYPPVAVASTGLPWERREDGFVCVGSLLPGKRMPWVIDVLARVREWSGADVRLHLVGPLSEHFSFVDDFYPRLRKLVKANGSWVTLHENASRDGLLRLLASQRYGIHAQVDEHFGIAPAEMLAAGCIPFVHNSGGQVEIVGRNEQLTFTSAEEAVAKTSRVLTNPAVQTALRAELDARRELFSTARFVREIRDVTAEFASQRAS